MLFRSPHGERGTGQARHQRGRSQNAKASSHGIPHIRVQSFDTEKETTSSDLTAGRTRPGHQSSLIDLFRGRGLLRRLHRAPTGPSSSTSDHGSRLVIENLLRARFAGFLGGLEDLLFHPDDFRNLVDDVDETLPL